MTLLSICQQVANETSFPAPSTIVGNNDATAKKLLAAAQTEGRVLGRGRKPDGVGLHDWSVLRTEQTFTTSNGTSSYALTSAGIITNNDFLRFCTDTFWDRTNQRPMHLFQPNEWQLVKSSVTGNTSLDRIIIQRGSSLLIQPTPTGTDTLVFEYISKNWCQSSGGTGQAAWAADTDVGVVDEHLITLGVKARFLQIEGLPYMEEREEYEQEVLAAMASDGGAPILRQRTTAIPFGRVPETGFGA